MDAAITGNCKPLLRLRGFFQSWVSHNNLFFLSVPISLHQAVGQISPNVHMEPPRDPFQRHVRLLTQPPCYLQLFGVKGLNC
jgi:hypothetical protein